MSFLDGAKALLDRAIAMTPLSAAAQVLAEVLDANRVTAADLASAAAEGRNLIVAALQSLPAESQAEARARGAGMAHLIPRALYGQLVEQLSFTHPEHAKALFAHRDWTVAQLDAARQWLAHGSQDGSGGPAAPTALP